MKKYNNYFSRIRSRHPSHSILRKGNELAILFPQRSVVRLGSTTPSNISLCVNTPEGVRCSSNKLAMKEAFVDNNIPSPEWWTNAEDIPNDSFPIIAKKIVGSRGRGIKYIPNREALNFNLHGYYFEKYYNYTREYRLHCSVPTNEMFYACRKMLKRDTPEDLKFCRNDANCSWFVETNPEFNTPSNWAEMCEAAIGAVNACGLDVGAVDMRVRGNIRRNATGHEFKIIEVNSAPSFAEITAIKYNEIIPKILRQKQNGNI